jgi:hypothetical protein
MRKMKQTNKDITVMFFQCFEGDANIATVTSTQTGLPTAGVAAGIAFLLVVIIMLIGAFIFIMRR